jgi:hypothetical protein
MRTARLGWLDRATLPAATIICCLTHALPAAKTECWRPTIDDVDRISWGRNAKQKGTGSRGVPHRLNDEERSLYDAARRKGFVEIAGTGWRRQRSDAPLVNTFRSWCDARAVPAIYLHKASDGVDEVVADLSPLRTPSAFEAAAAFCLTDAPAGGRIEFEGAAAPVEDDGGASFDLDALADAYLTQPIYRLPMYAVSWVLPRAEAKTLAKALAERLGTPDASKGRPKAKGAPRVKPGKSRRHGGYGIG